MATQSRSGIERSPAEDAGAPSSQTDIYSDPLIYDVLHAPGTSKEVQGLEKLARRFVTGDIRRVVEPACGSGRYLRLFALRGYDVVGMDMSPAMAQYAMSRVTKAASRTRRKPAAGVRGRGTLPRAHIYAGDMCDMHGEVADASIDFAFNMINTIRHLPDDQSVIAHVNEIARVLRKGGVYAVGISLSAYRFEGVSEDVWSGSRGSCSVHQVITYFPPTGAQAGRPGKRAEAVHSHLTVRRGAREYHVDSRYELRCYSLEQWHALIERTRMEIIAVVDEVGDDLRYSPPGYAIFVLGPR